MVSMKAPEPKPDPALEAQLRQQQGKQEQAVKASLSADTMNMLRLFGQQNAMAGTAMSSPMSGLIGSSASRGGAAR